MRQSWWNKKMLQVCFGVWMLMMIAACKKGSDPMTGSGSGYFLKFKSNGTLVEYKDYAEGNFNKLASGKYVTSISGLKKAFVATTDNMSIAMSTAAQTQVNTTYTNFTVSSAGMEKAVVLGLGYYNDKGEFFMTWEETFAPALPPGTKTEAKCVITEQTDEYLKGKFSGIMYNEDFSTKLDITEGEFFVKRVR